MNGLLVAIDPGHGAPDPGAVGATGLREADVTLWVARQLRRELLQRNWRTPLLTREGEAWPGAGGQPFSVGADLRKRVNTANASRADLFISLHCNAAARPEAHGTETWYFDGSTRGRRLAAVLQEALIRELCLANRGIKPTRELYLLKHTVMPAALVEIAFLGNPAEEELLRDQSWLARAARALADGIEAYASHRTSSRRGKGLSRKETGRRNV